MKVQKLNWYVFWGSHGKVWGWAQGNKLRQKIFQANKKWQET